MNVLVKLNNNKASTCKYTQQQNALPKLFRCLNGFVDFASFSFIFQEIIN